MDVLPTVEAGGFVKLNFKRDVCMSVGYGRGFVEVVSVLEEEWTGAKPDFMYRP